MPNDATPTVKAMMERALSTTGPAAILAFATEMTKPKSAWKGPRKLSREQALAATRSVTSMLRRFELQPTKVLVGAGAPASLVRRDVLPHGPRDGRAEVTKRLATGIGAHVDHVKAVARHARQKGHAVDEAALLAELAEAVGTFLEPFRAEPELDPDASLRGTSTGSRITSRTRAAGSSLRGCSPRRADWNLGSTSVSAR